MQSVTVANVTKRRYITLLGRKYKVVGTREGKLVIELMDYSSRYYWQSAKVIDNDLYCEVGQ